MPSPKPLFEASPESVGKAGGRTLTCVSCGLYREVRSPRIVPYGQFARKIMVVGEAPGEQEDKKGKPWQGPAGRLLKGTLSDLGIDLFRDCVSTNSINCQPAKNRTPTPFEVACCRVRIVQPALRTYDPAVILLMGSSAISSIIGSIVPDAVGDSIGKWRGFQIPWSSHDAWICPTFHPSYILREDKRKEITTIWQRDLKAALAKLDVPVPAAGDLRNCIVLLHDEDSILRALQRVRVRKGFLSFDYETTGLIAQAHKIVCASFCQSGDKAYAFMMDYATDAVKQAWREVLLDPEIKKISHNLSFEAEYSRVHFGVDEIEWGWDSMLSSHIVDNRPGICGLKHQSFVTFGVLPYDGLVAPYLESGSRNPLDENRIHQFVDRHGEDELLIYCGIDSLMAFRLAMRHMEIILADA